MKDIFYTEELFFENEEKPFLLPEERGILPSFTGTPSVFKEEHHIAENSWKNESYENHSLFQKVQHSLFQTQQQNNISISPQICVEISSPQAVSAETLAEEIKERICREICSELGGYLNW